jgi:hypothetical protein
MELNYLHTWVMSISFNKLLQEASELYSSVNIKDSIENQEFSIANIISVILEEEKNEVNNQNAHRLQRQKNQQEVMKATGGGHQESQQNLPTTATKYECTACEAIFDTPAGHRKHYQAFHESIGEPKIIQQAEI